jgi:hypothetical protein
VSNLFGKIDGVTNLRGSHKFDRVSNSENAKETRVLSSKKIQSTYEKAYKLDKIAGQESPNFRQHRNKVTQDLNLSGKQADALDRHCSLAIQNGKADSRKLTSSGSTNCGSTGVCADNLYVPLYNWDSATSTLPGYGMSGATVLPFAHKITNSSEVGLCSPEEELNGCSESTQILLLDDMLTKIASSGAVPGFSVGGGGNSALFSYLAQNPSLLLTFAQSVATNIVSSDYKFIDFDIEDLDITQAEAELVTNVTMTEVWKVAPDVKHGVGIMPAFYIDLYPIEKGAKNTKDSQNGLLHGIYFGYDWNYDDLGDKDRTLPVRPMERSGTFYSSQTGEEIGKSVVGALQWVGEQYLNAGYTVEEIEEALTFSHAGFASDIAQTSFSLYEDVYDHYLSQGNLTLHPDYLEFQVPDGSHQGTWLSGPETIKAAVDYLSNIGIDVEHDGTTHNIKIKKHTIFPLDAFTGTRSEKRVMQALKGETLDPVNLTDVSLGYDYAGNTECDPDSISQAILSTVPETQGTWTGYKSVDITYAGNPLHLKVSDWNVFLLGEDGQNVYESGTQFSDSTKYVSSDFSRIALSEKVCTYAFEQLEPIGTCYDSSTVSYLLGITDAHTNGDLSGYRELNVTSNDIDYNLYVSPYNVIIKQDGQNLNGVGNVFSNDPTGNYWTTNADDMTSNVCDYLNAIEQPEPLCDSDSLSSDILAAPVISDGGEWDGYRLVELNYENTILNLYVSDWTCYLEDPDGEYVHLSGTGNVFIDRGNRQFISSTEDRLYLAEQVCGYAVDTYTPTPTCNNPEDIAAAIEREDALTSGSESGYKFIDFSHWSGLYELQVSDHSAYVLKDGVNLLGSGVKFTNSSSGQLMYNSDSRLVLSNTICDGMDSLFAPTGSPTSMPTAENTPVVTVSGGSSSSSRSGISEIEVIVIAVVCGVVVLGLAVAYLVDKFLSNNNPDESRGNYIVAHAVPTGGDAVIATAVSSNGGNEGFESGGTGGNEQVAKTDTFDLEANNPANGNRKEASAPPAHPYMLPYTNPNSWPSPPEGLLNKKSDEPNDLNDTVTLPAYNPDVVSEKGDILKPSPLTTPGFSESIGHNLYTPGTDLDVPSHNIPSAPPGNGFFSTNGDYVYIQDENEYTADSEFGESIRSESEDGTPDRLSNVSCDTSSVVLNQEQIKFGEIPLWFPLHDVEVDPSELDSVHAEETIQTMNSLLSRVEELNVIDTAVKQNIEGSERDGLSPINLVVPTLTSRHSFTIGERSAPIEGPISINRSKSLSLLKTTL